jgi:hypothetical protein
VTPQTRTGPDAPASCPSASVLGGRPRMGQRAAAKVVALGPAGPLEQRPSDELNDGRGTSGGCRARILGGSSQASLRLPGEARHRERVCSVCPADRGGLAGLSSSSWMAEVPSLQRQVSPWRSSQAIATLDRRGWYVCLLERRGLGLLVPPGQQRRADRTFCVVESRAADRKGRPGWREWRWQAEVGARADTR